MELKLPKKKFLTEENVARIVKVGINFGERLNSIESACIEDFSESKNYLRGDACYKDGYIYRAVVSTTGAWVESRWTKVGDEFTELSKADIEAFLGLSTEQIQTLSSIILDSEIRLDKTYSSSKIYTDIKQCLDDSKAYTLAELGKASGASYKVVSSTGEMTEQKYIYLMSDGSGSYNLYIVEDDGGTVQIGNTTINLSDYYTKTEVDNDFLKKSDATSTYATITTVDGKVNKTDIVDNLTSTDTDKPLSANQGKVLKDEVDLKANDSDVVKKTDIVTTIDKTSTDDKIPTAKAIYNNPKNKILQLSTGTDILEYADSIGAELVTITVKLVNGVNCPYGASVNSSDFYYTIYNINHENYKRIVAYDIRKNDMYMNIKHVTWGNWQKVCATSVADVPFTKLTLDSSVFTLVSTDACLAYSVCNGMCTITCCGVGLVSVGNHIVTNNIPKPMGGYASNILQVGAGSNVPTTPVFLIADGNGLAILSSTHTGHFWGTLTYPVAES